MSAPGDPIVDGAPATLRDGSRVRIRQERSSDGDLLRDGFAHLSPESRYRRFLAPTPALSASAVRQLTDVDHHDREAMIALDEHGAEPLGVARYVRDAERPETAEVAVNVVDDWQGRGLGTLLLDELSARARAEGIRTFTAWMLACNQEMMDLFQHLGPVRIVDRDAGTLQVAVALPVTRRDVRQATP
jgi:GNAT superfamily N-acetyltransferase